ncbi:MAG: glycosyltransferase [Desulfitobacterium sp.]
MNPKISIVVPIYNVERHLDQCVGSIRDQTYSHLEIILVDDGSPDGCPEMCDDYAKQDSRIKVIHQINGGLSEARNSGLSVATGEYILFVDADDYIDLNACESLIDIMNKQKPDIVVGNVRRIEGSKVFEMSHALDTQAKTIAGADFLKNELKTKTMHRVVCPNLFKREFLLANQLEFKVGILHEDAQFTPRAFLRAKEVMGTNLTFYNYLIREGSITKKADLTVNGIDLIQTCYELAGIYKALRDKELIRLLNDDLVTLYLYGFQIGRLYRKEYKPLISKGFLIKRALSLRNRGKVILFVISIRLYFFINAFLKALRR